MRICRLTSTSFALSLLSSNHYQLLIGMKEKQNAAIDEDWQCKILDELILSWFSSKRSSESMKRGTTNESKAMEYHLKKLINFKLFLH